MNLAESAGLSTLKLYLIETANDPVPTIVLTGQDKIKTGLEAILLGAEDFLSKNEIASLSLLRAVLNSMERFKVHYTGCDQMTRVSHLQSFSEWLAGRMVQQATEGEGMLAVAMFDIRDFAGVNEQLSDRAGDNALKIVGSRLVKHLGVQAVARCKDNTFVVGFDRIVSLEQLHTATCDTQERITEPFLLLVRAALREITLSFSTSVVIWDGEVSADELIDLTHGALHVGKEKAIREVVVRTVEAAQELCLTQST